MVSLYFVGRWQLTMDWMTRDRQLDQDKLLTVTNRFLAFFHSTPPCVQPGIHRPVHLGSQEANNNITITDQQLKQTISHDNYGSGRRQYPIR